MRCLRNRSFLCHAESKVNITKEFLHCNTSNSTGKPFENNHMQISSSTNMKDVRNLKWNTLKRSLVTTAKEHIPLGKVRTIKLNWMTGEILDLMKES